MRNFRLLKKSAVLACLFLAINTIAQVAPEVSVIELGDDGEGNVGVIETIINGDVDAATGMRLNPNRVYKLKGGAFYTMVSGISFGSALDTTATLILEGEEGGIKPIVLKMPLDQGTFSNVVNGSLVVKNVYFGALNVSNAEGGPLFDLKSTNQSITLERVITENAQRGPVVNLRGILGKANIYIKDCYFRDNSWLGNSWNHSVFERGDNGEAIDTLWVENTTVTNSGMPFFGKNNPVNFAFFNHNTIINSTKYPLWMEHFGEAYFTNNVFVNANFEGECQATWETQLVGDGIKSGIINVDTIEADMWFIEDAPKQEDVIFYASNNLSFYSPYLQKYYSGGYNDVANHPISNRSWGSVTGTMLPTKVHAPLDLFNERALGLAKDWPRMVIEDNIDKTTDPMFKTKSIKDQAAGDEFAKFIRNNYSVAKAGETWDVSVMFFGDADASTIPGLVDGVPSETSVGMKHVTDIPDDFSYEANILSGIDGKHLGALHWFPEEMNTYNSAEALTTVRTKYSTATGTKNIDANQESSLATVYPNPANNVLTIQSKSALNSVRLFDLTGQMLKQVDLNGAMNKTIQLNDLSFGIYIIKVESSNGTVESYKFRKK